MDGNGYNGYNARPGAARYTNWRSEPQNNWSMEEEEGTLSSAWRDLLQFVDKWKPKESHAHGSASPKPLTGAAASTFSTGTFVLLCGMWYLTSALSSNTGKAIVTQFPYPVTLTIVQFAFVAGYCGIWLASPVSASRFKMPNKTILRSTLPMGMFQVGGHMFSSIAISKIPVSTLHTIKALSPAFTVAAYALLFGVSYSAKTYISLIPLTIGVMLACTFNMTASNVTGLLCALGSAMVFVSSNIFFKKIMPSNGGQTSHKLDKINLLFYSSSMALILMMPIWLYYDLPVFLGGGHKVHAHPSHDGKHGSHSVAYYFFMNGTVHFAQNIIAFVILASTSPVTYSIASLIKRVAVICIAIVWFSQTVSLVQAFGICMTFVGLWMYNNAKGDVEKGEKKMRRVEAQRDLMLPSTKSEVRMMNGGESPPELAAPVIEATRSLGKPRKRSGTLENRGKHTYVPPPVNTMPQYVSPPTQQYAPAPVHHHHQQQQPPAVQAAPPPSHPTPHSHHPKTSSRTLQPLANLSIKVTPPPISTTVTLSRTPGYPSPPPSLDSPPSSAATLGPENGVTVS